MSNPLDRIKYDSEQNLITIKALSEPKAADIIKMFDEVIKLGRLKNCTNVLLDGSKTKKLPSPFEIFSIGKYIADHAIDTRDFKIAYVISNEVNDDFRFFDNVATNRGADVNTFNTISEAKAWLLDE